MAIQGMEEFSEFTRVGPIVLECANMPPFAGDVRQVTKRPVFDIITLLNSAWAGCRG